MTRLTNTGTLDLDRLRPERERSVIIEGITYTLNFEHLLKNRDDSIACRILDRLRGGLSSSAARNSAEADEQLIREMASNACPDCPNEVLDQLSLEKLTTMILHANKYNRRNH